MRDFCSVQGGKRSFSELKRVFPTQSWGTPKGSRSKKNRFLVRELFRDYLNFYWNVLVFTSFRMTAYFWENSMALV